jgi:hypothetical protein
MGNGVGLRREDCGAHSLRPTKAFIIYKQSENLRTIYTSEMLRSLFTNSIPLSHSVESKS